MTTNGEIAPKPTKQTATSQRYNELTLLNDVKSLPALHPLLPCLLKVIYVTKNHSTRTWLGLMTVYINDPPGVIQPTGSTAVATVWMNVNLANPKNLGCWRWGKNKGRIRPIDLLRRNYIVLTCIDQRSLFPYGNFATIQVAVSFYSKSIVGETNFHQTLLRYVDVL